MGMTGEEIIYALHKGATWGTAAVCGAGDGFLGLPWDAEPDDTSEVDDSLGLFFAADSSPGQTKIEPGVNTYARYNDKVILTLLAAFFGTAGVPATHAAGTLSKDHVLKMAKSVDGIFYTLAAKVGTGFVEEIPSLKVAKVVVTWETGKPVKFQFTGPGFDLVVDSLVNTLTTFNNVTVLEADKRAYMGQTVFLMNDQSDVALAAPTHKVAPSKAVLTLERDVEGFYGSFVDPKAGRELIDEPTNSGQPKGTLDLTYPRLKDNSGRLKIKNHTSHKAEIIMTGPIIEDAIPYLMKFQLPHLKPKKNANPHKHGTLENTRSYDVLATLTAPAGMVGNTDPCWCYLTNKIAVDLLA